MKAFQFHNPVFKSLLALLFASSINDFWSITFGMPTPTQMALLYGLYVFYFAYKVKTDGKLRPLQISLWMYTVVIVLSSSYVLLMKGEFNITAVTILINVLWLLSAIPYLSAGFDESDVIKFFKYVFFILLCITLTTGVYELLTHTNLLKENSGLSANVFYLRGLHLDKLEFSTMLASMIFISLSFLLMPNPVLPRLLLIGSAFTAFILLGLSYSTTALLGTVFGVIMLSFLDKRKVMLYFPFILILLAIIWTVVNSLDVFSEQIQAYELKYELNVNQADERNFRTMSWNAAYEKILESPLFGYGIGNSADVVLSYFAGNIDYTTNTYINLDKAINTHNFFCNELLDYGFIGAFPLFFSIGLVYFYLYKSNAYSRLTGSNFLLRIGVGLSCFMIFRFIFYYHRFDQSIYVIWISLVIGMYASITNRLNYESADSRT